MLISLCFVPDSKNRVLRAVGALSLPAAVSSLRPGKTVGAAWAIFRGTAKRSVLDSDCLGSNPSSTTSHALWPHASCRVMNPWGRCSPETVLLLLDVLSRFRFLRHQSSWPCTHCRGAVGTSSLVQITLQGVVKRQLPADVVVLCVDKEGSQTGVCMELW